MVEVDDRRWLCLEVSDKYRGNVEYFTKLIAVDIRHVAYFLYNRDITQFNPRGFNPRQMPSTEYQHTQKILNIINNYGHGAHVGLS